VEITIGYRIAEKDRPLNEPVARGGPFVMNTKDEIMQAFDDYKHNRF